MYESKPIFIKKYLNMSQLAVSSYVEKKLIMQEFLFPPINLPRAVTYLGSFFTNKSIPMHWYIYT